ncbi:hypothetical protein IKE79_00080 [Candidatus Saccharibacteria bacterium]|nr:hypothetical protein [Candidatus Saccharibacteria bacterium]
MEKQGGNTYNDTKTVVETAKGAELAESKEAIIKSLYRKLGQAALNIGAITEEIYLAKTPDNLESLMSGVTASDQDFSYHIPEERYPASTLAARPALRFQANPADFPLFSQQTQYDGYDENTRRRLPLDETLSNFVSNTAATISALTGETDNILRKEQFLPADHVIYLDKSARPVSWLVDKFWDDFTDKPQPPEKSYLAIDRAPWFRSVGIDVDDDGRRRDNGELATFKDFLDRAESSIPQETLARIRALYIPGGIKTEDPEKIFETPTILDGKVVTIVDEVERTGSTIQIAKWLLRHAIPEIKEVQTYGFWKTVDRHNKTGDDKRLASTPVWYKRKDASGRGVGEIDPMYYEQLYAEQPTDINRARKFGALALGTPFNAESETRVSSRYKSSSLELLHEIDAMRREYDAGHILLMPNPDYNPDRYETYARQNGLEIENSYDEIQPANNVSQIISCLQKRPPVRAE